MVSYHPSLCHEKVFRPAQNHRSCSPHDVDGLENHRRHTLQCDAVEQVASRCGGEGVMSSRECPDLFANHPLSQPTGKKLIAQTLPGGGPTPTDPDLTPSSGPPPFFLWVYQQASSLEQPYRPVALSRTATIRHCCSTGEMRGRRVAFLQCQLQDPRWRLRPLPHPPPLAGILNA